MEIDGPYHGREERQEYRVVARALARRKKVLPAVRDGPVAVLARAVHALEGLFVEKAHEPVRLGRLAESLHDEHVVVDGEIHLLEHGCELELRGRDLVVAGLRRDAELPETLLDLGHELQDARAYRAVVVVVELLVLGRSRAEDRAPRLEKVGPPHVVGAVYEEVFLLRAERQGDACLRALEHLHQPFDRTRNGLHRPQKRRLGVEGRARVGAEDSGNAQCRAVLVALDEGGARRIPRRVAARLEGRPQPAGRERRGVRLAAYEILPRKRHDRPRRAARLEERLVLFGGSAGERLEPVREMRRPEGDGPVLHPRRHFVGDGRIQGFAAAHRRDELGRYVFREVLPYRLFGKDVLAVRSEK